MYRYIENFRFSLQESFVALLPCVFLFSASILIVYILKYYGISLPFASNAELESISAELQGMFPLLLCISVAYHMTSLFGADRLIGTGLALTVYLSELAIGHQQSAAAFPYGQPIVSLVAPTVSLAIFSRVSRYKMTPQIRVPLSPSLTQALNLLLPFALSFCAALLAIRLIHIAAGALLTSLEPLLDAMSGTHGFAGWVVLRQLFWFIGLHGSNTLSFIMDPNFMQQEIAQNLTRSAFNNLFIGIGGGGATLSLIAATLLASKDRHMRLVALAGLPFAVFNISEPLVYGIPIVFNPRLLLPFIAVPLLNLFIAGAIVSTGMLSFAGDPVPWMTPVAINAYLRTEGFEGPILQFLLLAFGALLYMPFVRNFSISQSTSELRQLLSKGLDLESRLHGHHGKRFHDAQRYILRSHWRTKTAIDLIRVNELVVHYQPKVRAHSHECAGFEALLRLQMKDGRIVGPTFLETLEKAGFAAIVDRWVCERVARDLATFDGSPPISVNLHPDSLANGQFVAWLVDSFAGKNVEFEIIERGFEQIPELHANASRLRTAGVHLSIDDFGSGYSNLGSLTKLPVSTIKLDKGLLKGIGEPKGRKLYLTLTSLCRELGYRVVAEGVETREELEQVELFGVDYVQGWYFSPALPLDEANVYARQSTPAQRQPEATP